MSIWIRRWRRLSTNNTSLLIKLRKLDEVTLLELLEISSEEILDAFLDKVEEKENYLRDQLAEEELEDE